MPTIKVGVREFREQIARFLESDTPVAVTRRGETLGVYVPTPRRAVKSADLAELRAAADRLAEACLMQTKRRSYRNSSRCVVVGRLPLVEMIIVDANILIRAVLGRNVRQLLETYAGHGIRFYAPDIAYADAAKYLPPLLRKKGDVGRRYSCGARIFAVPHSTDLSGFLWPV